MKNISIPNVHTRPSQRLRFSFQCILGCFLWYFLTIPLQTARETIADINTNPSVVQNQQKEIYLIKHEHTPSTSVHNWYFSGVALDLHDKINHIASRNGVHFGRKEDVPVTVTLELKHAPQERLANQNVT